MSAWVKRYFNVSLNPVIVPTLCVGMPIWMLKGDAESPLWPQSGRNPRSHGDRGNARKGFFTQTLISNIDRMPTLLFRKKETKMLYFKDRLVKYFWICQPRNSYLITYPFENWFPCSAWEPLPRRSASFLTAERSSLHSHAERGNEEMGKLFIPHS